MSTVQDKDKDAAAEKPEGGKLTLSGKGTLSLKGGAASGRLRQNVPGSGGVAVEVRRSKRGPSPSEQAEGNDDPRLTNDEREARARALREALEAGEKGRTSLPKRQILERKPVEAAPKSADEKVADQRTRELEELRQIEEEERKKNIESRKTTLGTTAEAAKFSRFTPAAPADAAAGAEKESYRDRLKRTPEREVPRREDHSMRRNGRMTVSQALSQDQERDRGPSLAAQKRARQKAKMLRGAPDPAQKVFREVIVPENITVAELANRMTEPTGAVVKALMKLGVMATITQSIDADTAELLITEFGHKIKRVSDSDVETGLEGKEDTAENLKSRPPVVTIMGHVDHGKTSLLDALRSTDVVAGEAGGITQHIGAYQVTMKSGAKITFLDTPGHEAFTEMRARGANVTDIVVIVVAADDSVMPQTAEAISHARAAKVPMIIAINKVDLPDANPMKVKQQLLQYEVAVEEMGGDILCVEVSAKQKLNLDKLEETILLQSEVLDLKANPDREAQGVVIESRLEKGRGSVATVLIQKGTLKVGDIFVAGAETGKVRALLNDKGQNIDRAIPGQPVEVLGINGTPEAGDNFSVVADESAARDISEYRQRKKRQAQAVLAVKGRTTIEQLVAQRGQGKVTNLPVIIKADVHGSAEAIAGSLMKMVEENEGISVQILHLGVGGITESDVTLAKASGGLIIGFNVRANAQARELVARDGVDMRYYNIIYNVIDDAKALLSGMLSPTQREEYLGQAEIRQVFNITKVGKIAGCMVTTGMVKRGAKVRLLRDNVVIHEGMLKTLKRFKDEVKEVKEGTECGMAFESYDDIKEKDIIECYEIVEEARHVT